MAFTVLIVDDSVTMRSVIKRTLEMANIAVGELLEAGNGDEALGIMQQKEVNLVLADINMPGMNGIEMIERMCADDRTRRIPVVVISTEASTARIEQLQEKGIVGYVHKPFSPEIIRDVIFEVIGACHAKS
ncbi:MAG: response regulator [Sedimentisphaerales bacterium]|nr:response regulator [Sedimentisphaerales bacterium]